MTTTHFIPGTTVTSTWLNEVDAATFDGSAVYTPSGTGAVATTMQTKLREFVSVKDYGAVGDGVTDDSAAIQAAITANKGVIHFPNGTYAIRSVLTVSATNVTLSGGTKGMVSAAVSIKYIGIATASAMLTVGNGCHGFSCDGIEFNANGLANICLYIIANAGSSTHHPAIKNTMLRGYVTRGMVLGNNDTATLSNGQMQNVILERVYWQGGTLAAIGLLVNAQNIEFIICNSLYFDVEPTAYDNHSYHIWGKAGGINIQGMVSTRCDTCAIYSAGSQIVVSGWRSEDPMLFNTIAAELEGPCTLTGVVSRGGAVAATDAIIEFNGIESVLSLNGCKLNGSITFGGTSAKYVSMTGVSFTDPACVITYNGPQNVSGFIQDATTGNTRIRGTGAALLLETEAGTDLIGLVDGYLYTPTKTITSMAAAAPALDVGSGHFFNISGTAAWDVQGIVPEAGRNIRLVCTGSFAITLKHLSASATSNAHRIRCTTGADIVLAVNEMAELVYDSPAAIWRAWKL